MILTFSGHRPDKLVIGGWKNWNQRKLDLLINVARVAIRFHEPDLCIVGGAQGWDEAAAFACIELGIPFLLYAPHDEQEGTWPPEAQERYREYAAKADNIIVVNPGPYETWKMQARNDAMGRDSDVAALLWNGTPGGTFNFVNKTIPKYSLRYDNWWDRWQHQLKVSR